MTGGDSPPPGHSSNGRLERVLRSGGFAVTAELNPPDSADPGEFHRRAAVLAGVTDALNAAGPVAAVTHMSSLGASALLRGAGIEPVLQVTCRDHNRIAIQGDVLAAAALGVCNILCLTGDAIQVGDAPGARPVFDLDSITLLKMLKTMRDEGRFSSGRPIADPPAVFLGAAANPFAPPLDMRPPRLAKKIDAGAQFVQTQFCFDVPAFEDYMARVRDLGLDERCFIIAGVGPLASAGVARRMKSKLPGVHIPDAVIERLAGAADPEREGRDLCVETIQQLKEISGVSGVHVMAWRREEMIAGIIAASGVAGAPTAF